MSAGIEGFHATGQRQHATWAGCVTWIEGDGFDAVSAIAHAGLDFEVEKVPVLAPAPGVEVYVGGEYLPPSDTVTIPNRYSVRRTDSGEYLTSGVGSQWTAVQNREFFGGFGGSVIGSVEAPWVSGGSVRGGGICYMQARVNRDVLIGGDPDERVDPLLTLWNYHDGTGGLGGGLTPVRVVCENTCALALSQARTIRLTHRTNIADRLDQARDVLRAAVGYFDEYEQTANRLLKRKVSDTALQTFLAQLLPYAPDANLDKDRAARNKEEARQAVRALLSTKPDLQNIRGTAWGTLQAVADYADHQRPTRGTDRMSEDENLFARIVLADSDPLKDRAFALLTA